MSCLPSPRSPEAGAADPRGHAAACAAVPVRINVLGQRLPRHASLSDRAFCRALIRDGSRTFHAASLLLPPDTRDAAYALYAFCRVADDAVDEGADRAAALAALSERLEAIYADAPAQDPVDRAFADAVRDHGLPKAPMVALLEGLAWDLEGRRYRDLSGVLAYSARVAATVGVMMTVLMGRRDPAVIARACDLGLAMQLTNIARDVGEDARNGRIYLPLDWLAEEGVDADAFLAAPAGSAGVRRAAARLVAAADELYRRSEPGIAALPARCRPGIWGARLMYAAIGERLLATGTDPVEARTVVPGGAKARLMARALARTATARPVPCEAPPHPETAFLIDAVVAESRRSGEAAPPPWALDARIGRFVLLIGSLSARERTTRGAQRI